MHVTSLEIILAVVAVFVVFGPKEMPRFSNKQRAVKAEKERIPFRPTDHLAAHRAPSQYAAGRAPSPLQLRAAERPMVMSEARKKPQFAAGERDASPLPHELLRV